MRRAILLAAVMLVTLAAVGGVALAETLAGTNRDDRLIGSNNRDSISGGGGEDLIGGSDPGTPSVEGQAATASTPA